MANKNAKGNNMANKNANDTQETKATEKKLYRVVIHNPELRKKDGTYECWVNGNFYKIPENKPVELKPEVISHLKNHRAIVTLPTGENKAVEIEEGFKTEVSKSFDIIEV